MSNDSMENSSLPVATFQKNDAAGASIVNALTNVIQRVSLEEQLMASCLKQADSIFLTGLYDVKNIYPSDNEIRFLEKVNGGSPVDIKMLVKSRIARVLFDGSMAGLTASESLRDTHIVNNRTAIFGDSAVSIILRQIGTYSFKEEGSVLDRTYKISMTFEVNGNKVTETYSQEDAEISGSLPIPNDKGRFIKVKADGSVYADAWTTNPKRMMRRKLIAQVRSMHFPGVLAGLMVYAEDSYKDIEAQEIPYEEVTQEPGRRYEADPAYTDVDTLSADEIAAMREKEQQKKPDEDIPTKPQNNRKTTKSLPEKQPEKVEQNLPAYMDDTLDNPVVNVEEVSEEAEPDVAPEDQEELQEIESGYSEVQQEVDDNNVAEDLDDHLKHVVSKLNRMQIAALKVASGKEETDSVYVNLTSQMVNMGIELIPGVHYGKAITDYVARTKK